MESITKPISQISRDEWVAYRQIEVTCFGDKEPMFLRGIFRNPNEVKKADEDFSAWILAANRVGAKEKRTA